jgi:hypothetical protein
MFEVVVRGRLSRAILSAFDGLASSRCDGGLTYLVLSAPDQSRLHAMFQVLRDLNIELVSVNEIGLPPLQEEG